VLGTSQCRWTGRSCERCHARLCSAPHRATRSHRWPDSQPNWRSQVVVTGLGTITSLGHDAHTFFDNLVEGKCGIDYVTRFDAEKWEVPARIVSEVKDFDVGQYWRMKDAKRCVPPHLPPTSLWTCMHIGALPPHRIALEVYLRVATLRASL
jgi:hypothetical protein